MYIDPNRFRAAALRARGKSLDSIHLSIRVSTRPIDVANLLDEYIVLAALRASARMGGGLAGNSAAVMGGMIPGGAIVSAAVSSVSSMGHGSGGAVASAYAASG